MATEAKVSTNDIPSPTSDTSSSLNSNDNDGNAKRRRVSRFSDPSNTTTASSITAIASSTDASTSIAVPVGVSSSSVASSLPHKPSHTSAALAAAQEAAAQLTRPSTAVSLLPTVTTTPTSSLPIGVTTTMMPSTMAALSHSNLALQQAAATALAAVQALRANAAANGSTLASSFPPPTIDMSSFYNDPSLIAALTGTSSSSSSSVPSLPLPLPTVTDNGAVSTLSSTLPMPQAQPRIAIPIPLSNSNDVTIKYVRMRGLPWTATPYDIITFFHPAVVHDSDIVIVTNLQGRATGDAYVTLHSENDTAIALSKSRGMMGRRYVEVYTTTRDERNKAVERQNKMTNSATNGPVSQTSFVVRLRGLPFTATEENIRTWFNGLPILAIHLVMDTLGRPSGDAFIELATEELALGAMAYNRRTMGTRYVELFRSNTVELTNALTLGATAIAPTSRQAATRGGHGGHGGYHSSNLPFTSSLLPTGGRMVGELTSVKMSGIPYTSTDAELVAFFQAAGVTPLRVHRRPGAGDAYVEFSTAVEARLAMTRHKQHLGRRYVELLMVSNDEVKHHATVADSYSSHIPGAGIMAPNQHGWSGGRQDYGTALAAAAAAAAASVGVNVTNGHHGNGNGYGHGNGNGHGGMNGHSLTPLTSLPSAASSLASSMGGPATGGGHEPGTRVKLVGLPYRATRDDINTFFTGFDYIETSIEFCHGGIAFVLFRKPSEAQRASAALDGKFIGGRYVKFSID